MISIVKQTKYGDTIFVSHPFHAARALVSWAVVTYGLIIHSVKNLSDGCIKVEIPGLTEITYAPEKAPKV
jgi:hypothetical protein